MSQILYDTLSEKYGPVHVQTGWDRQTQSYHLTVWRIGKQEPIFDDCGYWPQLSLVPLIALFQIEQIPLPDQVLELLYRHGQLNAGNEIVRIGATER